MIPGAVRAVVFDMDGVLADTEPLHYQAAREVLAGEGRAYGWETNRRFFGRTTAHVFQTLARELALPRPLEAYLEAYDQAVRRRLREPLAPCEGLGELLQALAARGLPAALASSSQRTWIDDTLSALGLTGRFAPVVAGDMVREGKPAPEIYLLCAERLGVPPATCVAVEDSPSGLAAARAAGMHAIGLVTRYFQPAQLADAHRLIVSLRDFPVDLLG